MNLALWLHRAGLSHPDLAAVASGARVVARYGDLAGRAARLAGGLRDRLKLNPGDRVAIVAKNAPDYHRAAVRHLACRPRGCAGQRQTARR